MKDSETFGIKNINDKLRLVELNEDILLSMIYRNNGIINHLDALKEPGISAIQKSHLTRYLLLLKEKGYLTTDGISYKITWNGKIRLIYKYEGWSFIAVVIAIIALVIGFFTYFHPINSESKNKKLPQQNNQVRNNG